MCYDFIRLQYRLGRIDKTQVEQLAARGWITPEEAVQIINKD